MAYIGNVDVNQEWTNLVTALSLQPGQSYEIQNQSIRDLLVLEVSAAPTDEDNRGLTVAGGASRQTTIQAGQGVYVRTTSASYVGRVVVVDG